jgi:two-component system, chemotaxis family, sensor kinase CheA
MDELEEFRAIFFQECLELLTALEDSLALIESGEATPDTIHAAFRAIHSIKGGAGAFGFDGMVGFCHIFESVLDRLRNEKIENTPDLIRLMLRSKDVVTGLVEKAQAGDNDLEMVGADVKVALQYVLDNGVCAPSGVVLSAPVVSAPAEKAPEANEKKVEATEKKTDPAPAEVAPEPDMPQERDVIITFKPDQDILRLAIEPLTLVKGLKNLSSLNTKVIDNELPENLSEYDPNWCYLSWKFTAWTDAPRDAIEDIFIFAREFSSVEIEDTGESSDSEDERSGLIANLSQPASEIQVVAEPVATSPSTPVVPEPVTTSPSEPVVSAPKPASPAPEASEKRPTATATKPTITLRVDLPRIDRLVNMVGETVITQAVLAQQALTLSPESHPGLIHAIESLSRQTRELQESVMAIRAQPVKSVFQRMNRLVRELSTSLGKEARLVIFGEQTEIDSTVIEELADPLTHMIRNSMDHGLEATAEDRIKAGKPAEGTIRLSAEHRSSRIIITISDDGRGINREVVLRKAMEKGLVPADAKLSVEEIENLIFAPGFSTADVISNVSGRGVGMDVVRRNIQALGGRVGISSNPGKGTVFTMTLPLTLAVMDGMIIRAGHENFVIPITSIVEALRMKDCERSYLPNGEEVFSMRGQYIRLINLGSALNLELGSEDTQIIVVETEALGRVGLVVDDLLGQQQVVIKSLEVNYRRVEGISGATILGDGKVALILDVDTIASMVKTNICGGLSSNSSINFNNTSIQSMEIH